MKEHKEPLVIAKTIIQPGEAKIVRLPSPRLYTRSRIDIPVHVIRSEKPGPRLFVIAAIHGDEINGIEIIRRLLKMPELKKLKGTLITVPVANVYGLINQSRYLPDRRDLNRSFPGNKRGSLAARLAYRLLNQIIVKCDYGIDLHTGSKHRRNLPQLRVHLEQSGTKELAEAFEAPVIIDASIREGSLREACRRLEIPLLVYECGEALRFSEFGIRIGLKGVLKVMAKIGMLPKITNEEKLSKLRPTIAHATMWVRAPASGILHQVKTFGSHIKKGELLAIITDPLGTEERQVVSPVAGVIIGINNLPLINAGDALFYIGCFESAEVVAAQIDELHSFVEW